MTIADVGTFNITSGNVYVTDPCYNPGEWCQGYLQNVLCGKWQAQVNIEKTNSWGERVSVLYVFHEAYKNIEIPMDKQTFVIGVDAGVAGFFDASKWCGRAYSEEEYFRLCEMTYEYPQAGCVEYGVISSSGYGDGAYDCFVGKNEEGKIVCMSIVFISDEEEEDEEDFFIPEEE